MYGDRFLNKTEAAIPRCSFYWCRMRNCNRWKIGVKVMYWYTRRFSSFTAWTMWQRCCECSRDNDNRCRKARNVCAFARRSLLQTCVLSLFQFPLFVGSSQLCNDNLFLAKQARSFAKFIQTLSADVRRRIKYCER